MRSKVHPKYKTKYRVGNWSAYEQALVQRGDVTLWLSADATDAWRPSPSGRPGAPKTFSDCAIETALTLRLVFRLPVRQAEGFLRSVLSLMGVDLAAPDHTTLSRRSQSLAVEFRRIPSRGPIHLIVDSTGRSIVGEGEWALERAFARFGGVPKELLFDQMRAVVLSDGRVGGGELVLNAEFLRVAAHWGFHPRACRPYRAQTKGKVERPIRYIRDSFFYGRAFANDEDLNEQASRWLEGTANVRRHSTTGARPVDRFERDEREALGPLARRPYQRFGVQPATEPTRRRVPNTVKVERRSLRVYAEAAG